MFPKFFLDFIMKSNLFYAIFIECTDTHNQPLYPAFRTCYREEHIESPGPHHHPHTLEQSAQNKRFPLDPQVGETGGGGGGEGATQEEKERKRRRRKREREWYHLAVVVFACKWHEPRSPSSDNETPMTDPWCLWDWAKAADDASSGQATKADIRLYL